MNKEQNQVGTEHAPQPPPTMPAPPEPGPNDVVVSPDEYIEQLEQHNMMLQRQILIMRADRAKRMKESS